MRREIHPNKSELKKLLRTLNKGWKAFRPEDLAPRTPHPDSSTFASYITGELDEEGQQRINAHIAFCDACFEEYVALAGPKEIAKILNKAGSLKERPAKANVYQDLVLKCVECGAEFVFTSGEQMFFADKGIKGKPKRCKACEAKRTDAPRRAAYRTLCSSCGKKMTIAFEPTPGHPVYCRDCTQQRRSMGLHA